MITVVIPTHDSERLLVSTLSALVVGSAEGLLREVLLADAGSIDGTGTIADAAGCEIVTGPADEGSRLRAAAEAARGPWLMFLDCGAVLDETWTREVGAFVGSKGAAPDRVGAFRIAFGSERTASRVREAAASWRFAFLGRPRPDQGLLIAKDFYRSLGGHPAGADSHRQLLRRIGRGRFTAMRTRITLPED
jgi:glycosyltransferase involved in cell wall biosynthesis